jgi:hypothetical protein
MALYSRTDTEAQRRRVGATTALSSVNTDPAQDSNDQPADKVIPEMYIYVDDIEATIPANRNRGLTAPGWWKYRTYTDHAGNTRHKAQHLVAFKDAPTDNGIILTFTVGLATTILGQADAVYTNVAGASDGEGTGARFTITRDEDGDIDEVTLTKGGFLYSDGEEITIDGSTIGGVSVTDDLVITVATVSNDTDDQYAADNIVIITISSQPTDQSTQTPAGVILTFTEGAGTTLLAEADEEYEGVTGVADGDGVGATFTIVRDAAGAIDTVTLTDAGTGYVEGEEITIDGADIGGVSEDDDLVVTIDTVTTAAATFSVTASAAPSGTLIYQWQSQTAAGTRWTNISGATTDELELTGLTTSDSGKKYRVKVQSSTGAPEVTSDVAILTVTAA